MPLTARDVMETEVLSVPPGMSLVELEDFLISKRIGGVPVIEKGTLVGIVSRSDIVRALSLDRSLAGLVAEGLAQGDFAPAASREPPRLVTAAPASVAARRVRDIMAVDVVTVTPTTPLREVAQLLVQRHLHRVLVTEGTTVRGVISALDLVQAIAEGRLREA